MHQHRRGRRRRDELRLLHRPFGAALLPDGAFALSAGNALWLSQADGTSVIIAGSVTAAGAGGDGGAGLAARLRSPRGVTAVSDSVLVADSGNGKVRRLSLATNTMTTLIGRGPAAAASGDGGAPAAATLVLPVAVAVSPAGDVFVGDSDARCVRRARFGGAAGIGVAAGVIDTVVGTCGAPATSAAAAALSSAAAAAPLGLRGAGSIAFSAAGDLFVVDALALWRVDVAAATRVAIADWSAATPSLASFVSSIAVREDPAGAGRPASGRLVLFGCKEDTYNRVWAVPPDGVAGAFPVNDPSYIFAGLPNIKATTGDGGPARDAGVYLTTAMMADAAGGVYLLGAGVNSIRRVALGGAISTVPSGGAVAAGGGDGQLATDVALNGPRGIAIAPSGDVYFTEGVGARVRVLRANGTIGTIAGNGDVGYSGDGGPATAAALNFPYALAFFANGDLAIAQSSSGCVRRVAAATGVISTFAGVCGVTVSGGDGGPATVATFASLNGVAIDAAQNVYVCEASGRVVRVISAATGVVSRVAGTGVEKTTYVWNALWEGGAALAADFIGPLVVVLNPPQTHIFFTDFYFNAVFSVNVATNVLARVLGTPWDGLYAPGYAALPILPPGPWSLATNPFNISGPATTTWWGTNTLASVPQQASLLGLAFDLRGNLLVASSYDNLILSLNLSTAVVTIIAGNGLAVDAGDRGPPIAAAIFTPRFMAVDASGNIFLTASGSNTVREIAVGATPNCPLGYVCTCGLRPTPCESPAAFCPVGSAAAQPVAPGFAAVPAATPSGALVYGAQAACPVGSWCAGGVATRCFPGTYGTRARAASAATCAACAAGTYLAAMGAAAPPPAAAPCLRCPPGRAAAAPGAPFCAVCPPFTFARARGAANCSACAAGAFSLPGMAACVALGADDAASSVEGVANFQRAPAFNDGALAPTDLTALQAQTLGPVIAAFAVPLVLYYFLMSAGLLKRVPRFVNALREWDLFCDQATLPVGLLGSPKSLPTALGGGVSLLFIGVFFAFCATLLEQFALANTITSVALLQLTAADAAAIALAPPTAARGVADLAALVPGGVTAGLALVVTAVGAACAAPLAGSVKSEVGFGAFAPAASTFDNATGVATHVFACADCIPDTISFVEAQFDPACVAVTLTLATVGAWDTVSIFAAAAEGVSAVRAEASITAQSTHDYVRGADSGAGYATGGRSARGLFVDAFEVTAAPPASLAAVAAGTAAPVVVRVDLRAAAFFSRYTMTPNMTAATLLSNLLGNLGVLGACTGLFGYLQKLGRHPGTTVVVKDGSEVVMFDDHKGAGGAAPRGPDAATEPAAADGKAAAGDGAFAALAAACAAGDAPAAAALLAAHPKLVNSASAKLVTPLMTAARRGHADVVAHLLDAGARVNAVDANGMAALHHAVLSHDAHAVRAILDAGADATIVDARGNTPAALAASVGAGDVVVALGAA